MQKSNIKEILKPLVKKILLENEIIPDEKGSPDHTEEEPVKTNESLIDEVYKSLRK